MIKFTIIPTLLAASLCAFAQDDAQENTIVAKPLEYKFMLPAIKEMPRFYNPGSENKVGCEIVYLLTSGNAETVIKEVKSQNIRIDSITDNEGKDLSRNNNGKKVWHAWGKSGHGYTALVVFVETETPMLLPTLKGSVTVKAASNPETKNLVFKTAEKGQEQKAGPFTFTIEENDAIEKRKTWNSSARSGDNNPQDRILIGIHGNLNLFNSLTLDEGGKNREYTARHEVHDTLLSKDTIIYTFSPAPKTPEFTFSVMYYTEVNEVSVPFGHENNFPKPEGNP
jgi:hypothetical protein